MTIEEYKKRKKQLEKDIAAAIGEKVTEYERETGLEVVGVGVDIHVAYIENGTVWEKRFNASVNVPI